MSDKKIVSLIDQQMMLEDYWNVLKETHNLTDNRERRNVIFRHAFLVAARHFSNLSLMTLGRITGRHHATAVHANRCHEQNYTYDQTYRDTFDLLSKQIAERINNYSEDLEQMMADRLSKINVDVYENSLIIMYKKKLEKAERVYEDQIRALKHDLNIVSKQLRHHRKRGEELNEECLRLKNLL